MIGAICDVLGIVQPDHEMTNRIRRIADKVKSRFDETTFTEDVLAAEQEVGLEGTRALLQSFNQCNQIPAEREYKIKRVPKGQRINIVSETGIRYSFGPVWNDSVIAAKGIAVNVNNREKLNMQGTHLGVESPDSLSAIQLCAEIAKRLE